MLYNLGLLAEIKTFYKRINECKENYMHEKLLKMWSEYNEISYIELRNNIFRKMRDRRSYALDLSSWGNKA